MNIAIMSELYPSDESPYSAMYVHSRVVEYAKLGHKCNVYKLRKKGAKTYTFENIQIFEGDKDFLVENMKRNGFDAIAMHAPNPDEKNLVLHNFPNIKVTSWMHGLDSVSGAFSYPYAGNKLLHPARFIFRLKEDIRKYITWHRFIKHFNPKIVVVSNWMKEEAENFLKMKLKNTVVIPNPIDEKLFKFKQRNKLERIVCIRSHSSAKYGIDLVIKAFSNSKYSIDLYGTGHLLDEHKRLAKKLNSNVNFIEKLFKRDELAKVLERYDLAVMPSRHDTQGVMVCEMNIAGLPVITSNIPGNKEYKTKGTIRVDNDRWENIDKIIDNIKENISEMSKFAYEDMKKIASKGVVIEKELGLLRKSM